MTNKAGKRWTPDELQALARMIRAGHIRTVTLPTMTERRIPAWVLAELVGTPAQSDDPALRAVS